MDLTPEQNAQYTIIIDNILGQSDLATISEKKIRRALAERLGYDISDQKPAISKLILERFDHISIARSTTATTVATNGPDQIPQTNGHHKENNNSGVKRLLPDQSPDITSPKKKRKEEDSDAKLAALLQAEENSRARTTRGVTKKPTAARKKPVKKTPAKVKADDGTDVELKSDGEKKEAVRKGGFHKEYLLSDSLAALVGETKLSRPQVVKKIWDHIKALNLQLPNDKRQIQCDDKLYAVFKQETVHMFTMNKLLGKQLYPTDES